MLIQFTTEDDNKIFVAIAHIAAFEDWAPYGNPNPHTRLHLDGKDTITVKGGLDENMKKISEEMRKMAILSGQNPGIVGR